MDSRGPSSRKEGINEAIRDIKNFKTDILCKPWYFREMKLHVPNNTDYTIVPKDGKFVKKENCFEIAALPDNPLAEIREQEKAAQG